MKINKVINNSMSKYDATWLLQEAEAQLEANPMGAIEARENMVTIL